MFVETLTISILNSNKVDTGLNKLIIAYPQVEPETQNAIIFLHKAFQNTR